MLPAIIPLLFSLIPHIPGVIRAVESLYGETPGQGPSKLETAIDLIIAVAPDIATALNATPAARAILEKIIAIAVAAINASGTMRLTVPPAPVVERSHDASP